MLNGSALFPSGVSGFVPSEAHALSEADPLYHRHVVSRDDGVHLADMLNGSAPFPQGGTGFVPSAVLHVLEAGLLLSLARDRCSRFEPGPALRVTVRPLPRGVSRGLSRWLRARADESDWRGDRVLRLPEDGWHAVLSDPRSSEFDSLASALLDSALRHACSNTSQTAHSLESGTCPKPSDSPHTPQSGTWRLPPDSTPTPQSGACQLPPDSPPSPRSSPCQLPSDSPSSPRSGTCQLPPHSTSTLQSGTCQGLSPGTSDGFSPRKRRVESQTVPRKRPNVHCESYSPETAYPQDASSRLDGASAVSCEDTTHRESMFSPRKRPNVYCESYSPETTYPEDASCRLDGASAVSCEDTSHRESTCSHDSSTCYSGEGMPDTVRDVCASKSALLSSPISGEDQNSWINCWNRLIDSWAMDVEWNEHVPDDEKRAVQQVLSAARDVTFAEWLRDPLWDDLDFVVEAYLCPQNSDGSVCDGCEPGSEPGASGEDEPCNERNRELVQEY